MFYWLKSRKAEQGFSLVELMIVVAIIGVLAALAVPKFQSFQAKAKQSEAKSNLSHIYTLEQSFYGDQDKYSNNTETIGFTTQGHTRYDYKNPGIVLSNSDSQFIATALALNNRIISADCKDKDKWTITETKALKLVYDCVSNMQVDRDM
ncbi:MAG: hypothetical protein RL011_125 [Pseudomonadota bacterium]|jgi:type IV pilus assembly protein PilA